MAKKPNKPTPEPTPVPVDVPVAQTQPEPRRVRVLRIYRGRRTGEQVIMPGVYDADDPALYGMADYLILNGHAVQL